MIAFRNLLLLGLLALTSPNGNQVWIVSAQIAGFVFPPPTVCAPSSKTQVITLATNFCVREEPEVVIEQYKRPEPAK